MQFTICSICAIATLVGIAFSQPACAPEWCPMGSQIEGIVRSYAIFDAGTGPRLYAGGYFTEINGQPAEHLAVWDGHDWTPVLPGTNFTIYMLRVIDDGTGPALFVGGLFTAAGGLPANYLAKFDGSSWTPLPGLLPSRWVEEFSTVYDIVAWDRPTGREIYVGGFFSLEANPNVEGIARLTASGFEPVGDGLSGDFFERAVASMCVADLGTGPMLYVGGSFDGAGGLPARNVAAWDGENWSPLGTGLPEPGDGFGQYIPAVASVLPAVHAGQPVLLASGDVALNGIHGVAKWDGTSWTMLPGDFLPDGAGRIALLNRGGQDELFALGTFTSIGGDPILGIARRIGDSWEQVGEPFPNTRFYTVTQFDDGRGPALLAGANSWFFGTPRSAVGRFGTLIGDLNCDGAVRLADLAVLLSAFGSSDAGDLDGDGQTTIEDLSILLTKFGNACGI